MAETTFFVKPGGNLTKALKRKFGWMSIPEIEERKIPEVMRLNPHLTDPNVVRADVPYKVMDEERTFSRMPVNQPATYDPFNVRAYGQRQEDEKRAMLSMSRSQINSLVDREEEKTSRVVRMAQAFDIPISYTPPRRAGSATDPAKGIATSAEKEKINSLWYKMAEEGTLPRDTAGFEAFVDAVTPSVAGFKHITSLFKEYDWGSWKLFKKVNPNNVYGVPLEAWAQIKSPRATDLRSAGYKADLADDKAAIKHETAVNVITKFRTAYGVNPSLSDFTTFNKTITNPVERTALEQYAKSIGVDLPWETFYNSDESKYETAQKGTPKWKGLNEKYRKATDKEVSEDALGKEREQIEQRVVDAANKYEEKNGEYPSDGQYEAWVIKEYGNKLALLGGTGNTLTDVIRRVKGESGKTVAYETEFKAVEDRLEELYSLGVFNQDKLYEIIEKSNLPSHGDLSKNILKESVKDRIAIDRPTYSQSQMSIQVIGPDGKLQSIAVNANMYVDRQGRLQADMSKLVPIDDEIALTFVNGPWDTSFWKAGPSDKGLRKLDERTYNVYKDIIVEPDIKKSREQLDDVENRLILIDGALQEMAQITPGSEAYGTYDQFIADLWKKITDKSMITTEEFRTILEGQSWIDQIRLQIEKAIDGPKGRGSFLSPTQRRAILTMAFLAFSKAREKYHGTLVTRKKGFDERGGLWAEAASWALDSAIENSAGKLDPDTGKVIYVERPDFDDPKYGGLMSFDQVEVDVAGEPVVVEGFNVETDYKPHINPKQAQIKIDGKWIRFDRNIHGHLVRQR